MKASVCPNCTASVPINENSCAHCGTYLIHDEIEEKVEMRVVKGNSNTYRADNLIVEGSWNKIYGHNIIVKGNSNKVYGSNVLMHGSWNEHEYRNPGTSIIKSYKKLAAPGGKPNVRKIETKLTPLSWVLIGMFIMILIYALLV